MIKVLQFGEGNFLRTFVDAYFDTLNKEHAGEYEVNIVKPITFGSLEKFEKQNKLRDNIIKIEVIRKLLCGFRLSPSITS